MIFQVGDKVSYKGSKFSRELHGHLGIVLARIEKTQNGVVVDFGDDAYVMDEVHSLVPFQGQERAPKDKGSKEKLSKQKLGAIEVSPRRRIVDQEEE